MIPIAVSVDIAAPLALVWEEVSNLKGQERWMGDVESIAFEGNVTSGPGTVLMVATRVGPFRLTDRMTVTVWQPPHRIVVEHMGLVSGGGEFLVTAVAGATRFTWSEELRFPLYLGGPLAAALSRPILVWTWRHNLRRLKTLIEAVANPGF
ncbi:MAG: SRPBCC family protein [Acidimicrobiia bacterium]